MRRWLFNILAAVSLFVFAVVITFWLSSYWTARGVSCKSGGQVGTRVEQFHFDAAVNRGRFAILYIMSDHDCVTVENAREVWEKSGGNEVTWIAMPAFPNLDLRGWDTMSFAGLAMYAARPTKSGILHSFSVPGWVLAILWAALPTRWYWLCRDTQRTKQRQRLGLCLHCGYDLRASTDRCPECGTAVPLTQAAKGVAP